MNDSKHEQDMNASKETDMNREQILTLESRVLWSIVRSTNSLTERFCNELTWAKEELRRRGFSIA